MKLSQILKDYRKQNNLTQVSLADKLFVSKQAISKWENDKGYPDLSLYPVLSKMIGVSVDELMGLERSEKVEKGTIKRGNNDLKIISLICLLFVFLIAVFLSIINIREDSIVDDNFALTVLIENIEQDIGDNIQDIISWDYIDFSKWSAQNSLPNNIYYLTLTTPVNTNRGNWVRSFDEEIVKIIPSSMLNFLNTCDYFILINKTSGEINKIEIKDDETYDLSLICYQSANLRIIVINFLYN